MGKKRLLSVVIDDREPVEIVKPLFEKANFDGVKVERMDVGDYVLNGKVVISSKSYSDFLQSLYCGHLHDELGNMMMLPVDKWIALLIWKDEKSASNPYMTRETIMQVHERADKINLFYLPVIMAQSREDAIEKMYKLALKTIDMEFPAQFRRPIQLVQSNFSVQERMLCEISSIGEEIAVNIVRKYPTIEKLILAIKESHVYDKAKWKTKKEWNEVKWSAGIKNLGDKKADEVAKALLEG